jgi:glycosyltransferase involved in cell wall biosynthesis
MKISFFVNGSADDVMGIRANGLAKFLKHNHQIDLLYRDQSKVAASLRFFHSARKTSPDLVYVVGIGYSGVVAALAAKFILRSKMIIDTGDAVYELLKSMGNMGFFRCQMARLIEKAALTCSDVIIVQGSFHKTWLEQKGYRNLVHIPNGVEVSTTNSVKTNKLKKEFDINKHLVVGVMGSIVWSNRLGMCYGWDLIEALAFLKDLPVKGMIIGEGSGLSKLKELAKQKGIEEKMIFTGHLPYADIHDYLSLIDVCLSTQTNNLAGEVRTTAKLPEYLACGKYVIATKVGDAKYILPDIGMLLPYNGEKDDQYPKLLADKIKWLMGNRQELEKGKAGIRIASERFDYRILADALEQVLTDTVRLQSKP